MTKFQRGERLPFWKDSRYIIPYPKSLCWNFWWRNHQSTQKICELMQKAGREFVVLHFDLPDEIVYERLSSRIVCWKCGNNANGGVVDWVCEKCGWKLIRREDDSNIDAIRTRIEAFHNETELWLKWVEENGWLIHVDGNRSVDEIYQDVMKYV